MVTVASVDGAMKRFLSSSAPSSSGRAEPPSSSSSAEQPGTSLHSAEQPAEQPATSLRSAEQPARCNLAPEVWTRVAALAGSHQPLVLTGRVGCHGFWHRILWTPTRHYQRCGQSCPCCRAEHAEILGSCGACNDLWRMKSVCTGFKILLQAYGRQC